MFKPKVFKNPIKLPKNTKVVDAFKTAEKELFTIRNPSLKHSANFNQLFSEFKKKAKLKPSYIFYSNQKTLLITVPEKELLELRSARNKNIITEQEQENYRKLYVGIAGLSVGSAILTALVTSCGPKNIKIADFDILESTNLNRLHANLLDLNRSKIEIACQRAWENDPYLNLNIFPKGLNKKNLEKFLLQPKLDVFIDEMDNIEMKVMARIYCKKHKIPVLMATDNADGVILDLERFDLNPKQEIFNGRLLNENLNFAKPLDFKQWLQLANKIIGIETLEKKMQQSLSEIGKTLTGIPQLGTSANIAGSMVSLALRKIANKEQLHSGRYSLDLDKIYAARS